MAGQYDGLRPFDIGPFPIPGPRGATGDGEQVAGHVRKLETDAPSVLCNASAICLSLRLSRLILDRVVQQCAYDRVWIPPQWPPQRRELWIGARWCKKAPKHNLGDYEEPQPQVTRFFSDRL